MSKPRNAAHDSMGSAHILRVLSLTSIRDKSRKKDLGLEEATKFDAHEILCSRNDCHQLAMREMGHL